MTEHERYRLSRFAVIRREGERFVLESPRARVRMMLPDAQAVRVVAELAMPRTAAELSTRLPWLSEAAASAQLRVLAALGLVGAVDERGVITAEAEPPLAAWEFHDLLFHSRSRLGRHQSSMGATYRFRDALPPLPARKPRMSDTVISLAAADLTRLSHEDAPFVDVVERRRSIRAYDAQPISVQHLGEFLYRVARVRALTDANTAEGRLYERTNRPYPNGGAIYELELYVAVNACESLSRGLYHYDPFDHALERLSDSTAQTETLLSAAAEAGHLARPPQILIVITNRFQRRAWKYAGIAYANSLKNVGVLYQTMYLVATAMGLAPCALGAGDADLFAAATGLDPDVEASVGEFLLGRAARGSTTR